MRVADYGLLIIIPVEGPLSIGPFNDALLLSGSLLLIDNCPLNLELMLLSPGRQGLLLDLAISDGTSGCVGGVHLDSSLLPLAPSSDYLIKLSLNI